MTNPERLWVSMTTAKEERQDFHASTARTDVEVLDGWKALTKRAWTEPAEYVLASVARAETEAAVKKAIEEERARAWETCHVDE